VRWPPDWELVVRQSPASKREQGSSGSYSVGSHYQVTAGENTADKKTLYVL
jgi:hypothetical protein